jgi:hypothetical protein
MRPVPTIEEAVYDALANGSLYGAGYGKSCTVDGRRVMTVRLQSAIFGRFHGGGAIHRQLTDLVPRIDEAIEDWRAEHGR